MNVPAVLELFLLALLWTFVTGDVSCEFSQTCTLPCRFPPNADLVVHWIQMAGNNPVHSFYHKQDQLGYQAARFRGRTSLFRDQIDSGNASLQLREVEIQDEGSYKCYTSTVGGNSEVFVTVNVDVPVQKVNIKQEENKISCSSEGIYPKPELVWSTNPPNSNLNPTEDVQLNGQLFNITSSLNLSASDIDLNCTIRTRKTAKTATWFKQTNISESESKATIRCADSKTPVISLIWTFKSIVIVSQSEPGTPFTVSNDWRDHVKNVSETGALTLRNLSSHHTGVYMCEVTNADGTLTTRTFLQITEGGQTTVTAVLVPVLVLVLVVVLVGVVLWKHRSKIKCKKKEGERSQQASASGESVGLRPFQE